MPLSDQVRRELAAIDPQRDCDRLAELSGLFHTAGSLHLLGHGDFSVHLDVAESARPAARSACCARSASRPRSGRTRGTPSSGATRYQIHVPGGERPLHVLVRAGVLSRAHAPLEAPPKRVVGRACCRRAYLRGAFLGAGSVSGPRSPHLEIRTASLAGAELVAAVAAQEDVPLARPRPRPPRGRIRQGRRGDRRRARADGSGGRGALARRARGRRRGPRAGEPGRQRRPRQSRPHEPGGPRARSARSGSSRRRVGSRGSRRRCARSPSYGFATRPPRCASSRRNAARRRRRRPPTGG